MRTTLLLLSFLCPILLLGQDSLTFKIVDSNTGEPIPYALVALIKANTGVSSTEDGVALLVVKENYTKDTILVSSLGYEDTRISVFQVLEDTKREIRLSAAPINLQEIVVRPEPKSQMVLNRIKKPKKYGGIFSNVIINDSITFNQLGQFYQLPDTVRWYKIENIKVLLRQENTPQFTEFRFRVYDINQSGEPSDNLLFVKEPSSSKESFGFTEMDVGQENIWVKGKGFFVSIEWIKNSNNRTSSFRVGEVQDLILPLLTLRYRPKETNEYWVMDFNNQWSVHQWNYIFGIEVTLGYDEE